LHKSLSLFIKVMSCIVDLFKNLDFKPLYSNV
jgi:hypothetical protein